MLRKFVDVLKEVFWIKPSRKKALKPARRKTGKKSAVKKKIVKKTPIKKKKVGDITHYFDRIKVCVVKVTKGSVLIGDKLTIIGPKTKFVQKVWSMQIESLDVKVAKKGQLIGLKVDKLVAVGDKVYK
jgi:hypothetical protein